MRYPILRCLLFACVIGLFLNSVSESQDIDIPHLEQRDGIKKLIVDGRPFICVAGEVINTSSSDMKYMQVTISKLARANLNTILTVMSWDLIEPEEGKFDFSMIDYQIEAARATNVRLILLWFGSWKNGLSHFAPEWVKTDQERFPRVVNAEGNTLEILSTLSKATRDAEAKAFKAAMKHIREVDSEHHTVIMVQIENEVGVMGSTRDFCDAANEAYTKPVPEELTEYLQQNKNNLIPEFKLIWDAAGNKTSGTWEDIFGKNVQRPDKPVPNNKTRPERKPDAELYNHTDEIFMAWNYAKYIGYLAEQGKEEYPLPMFVNTWIVQTKDIGPGDYPSGGAEPLVHDIWRAGAPAIDIFAPDIYLPDFANIVKKFARNGNPAFIPETIQNAENCWTAFTELNAICFSPFGIDDMSPESDYARTYGLINSISGAIAEAQGKKNAIELIKLKQDQNPGKVEMGDYVFNFIPASDLRGFGPGGFRNIKTKTETSKNNSMPRSLFFGAKALLDFLDEPFLLIIQTAPNEYYFTTNGIYPFQVSSKTEGTIAAAASIESGSFINGKWIGTRRYNGDDLMRLGYDVSAAAAEGYSGTIIPLGSTGRGFAPAKPANTDTPIVTRVRFYQYK